MKYDDFLNAQEDKRLNAERIFSEFRQYFNQFIKSLHAGIGINEQFEIFSNFAEGIAKCRQERKKYKKELTAQQEREIERLAYCRPLRPFPEETRRLIEEYRKKRRQGR